MTAYHLSVLSEDMLIKPTFSQKCRLQTVLVANFDLHVAGTSRDHKKYVGQQVTTSAGSLACGFAPVAVENAATLMETMLNLLQELSEVYSAEERGQNFLRIFGNLSGVMLD